MDMKMNLQSMKTTPSEAKEYASPSVMKAPEYPYGLRIDLDKEQMEKLGLISLPAVGEKMFVHALVEVSSVSSSDSLSGEPDKRVCLQITDMQLDKYVEPKPATQIMYGRG